MGDVNSSQTTGRPFSNMVLVADKRSNEVEACRAELLTSTIGTWQIAEQLDLTR